MSHQKKSELRVLAEQAYETLAVIAAVLPWNHNPFGVAKNCCDVSLLKDGIRRKVMGLGEDQVEAVPSKIAVMDQADPAGTFNNLSHQVLGAAIEVHRHLGPGLLKSAYKECLCYKLSTRGLSFERSKPLTIRFRNVALPKPVEIDLVIAGELPLMIVSVAEITVLIEARLLGRLKNGSWKYGLLLNFSAQNLCQGIRRIVNPSVR